MAWPFPRGIGLSTTPQMLNAHRGIHYFSATHQLAQIVQRQEDNNRQWTHDMFEAEEAWSILTGPLYMLLLVYK